MKTIALIFLAGVASAFSSTVEAQTFVAVGHEGGAVAAIEARDNASGQPVGDHTLILVTPRSRRNEYAELGVRYDCARGERAERFRTTYSSNADPRTSSQEPTNIVVRLADRPDLAPQFSFVCGSGRQERRVTYQGLMSFTNAASR